MNLQQVTVDAVVTGIDDGSSIVTFLRSLSLVVHCNIQSSNLLLVDKLVCEP